MRISRGTKRFFSLIGIVFASSIFLYYILYSVSNNLEFYITPSQLGTVKKNEKLHVGGFVKVDSLTINNSHISFIITDDKNEIKVNYIGKKPGLLAENQPIIAVGQLNDNQDTLIANQIIAAHDEKYLSKKK